MATATRRRVRAPAASRRRPSISEEKRDQLNQYIDAAARLERDIKSMTLNLQQSMTLAEELMKELGIESFTTANGYVGEMVTPSSRSTREFDNHKVYDVLEVEDFLASVKVQATKIKEFLSQKEIDAVSELVIPKPKPKKLKVSKGE